MNSVYQKLVEKCLKELYPPWEPYLQYQLCADALEYAGYLDYDPSEFTKFSLLLQLEELLPKKENDVS